MEVIVSIEVTTRNVLPCLNVITTWNVLPCLNVITRDEQSLLLVTVDTAL